MKNTTRKITTIKTKNGKPSKPQTIMYVDADYSKTKKADIKNLVFDFCSDFYAVCKNNGTYDGGNKKPTTKDLQNIFDFCFSVYRVLDDYNYYKQNNKKQNITLKVNKKNGGG